VARVLILWEDRYCDGLDRFLRGAVRFVRRHRAIAPPQIFPHAVRGWGNFKPFVHHDWPRMRRAGWKLPSDLRGSGPVDYLLCVADADAAAECCRGLGSCHDDTDLWVRMANERWTTELRANAQVDAQRIHGCFVRWSRESLLIAGFDSPRALARLADGRKFDAAGLATFLGSCQPSPKETDDDLFVERFRSPGECLKKMLAAGGFPPLRKNAVPVEDALKELSREPDLERVLLRVPDLLCLAELLCSLE
jgi:hypothetical protein